MTTYECDGCHKSNITRNDVNTCEIASSEYHFCDRCNDILLKLVGGRIIHP